MKQTLGYDVTFSVITPCTVPVQASPSLDTVKYTAR